MPLPRRRRLSARLLSLSASTASFRLSSRQSVASSAVSTVFGPAAQLARLGTTQNPGQYRHTSTAITVTADRLSLILPIPPSINHQYATVNGRRLLSSAGRAYKAEVGRQVWIALAQSPDRTSLMARLRSGPLAFSIHFFFTTALRRDVDSGLKIAQDAICEGLGLNDNRIVETHLYKQVDKLRPRIEVSLALASPQPSTI